MLMSAPVSIKKVMIFLFSSQLTKYLWPPRRRKASQIRRRDEIAETDMGGGADEAVDEGVGESGWNLESSARGGGGGEGGGSEEGGNGPSANHG